MISHTVDIKNNEKNGLQLHGQVKEARYNIVFNESTVAHL